MKQITCAFFGISGAGKGTQAKLLIDYIKEHDTDNKVIYVETGQRFRDLMDSGTYTAKKIKEVLSAGKFLPSFLPIWALASLLIDEMKTGSEHMVLDGVSRQPEEGPVVDKVLQFYERKRPSVLLLEVHPDKARQRLIKRGRFDDKHEKITERFHAFEEQAMPVIRYFEKNPNVEFVRINGDQTIEKVFEDIKKTLGI